jgi:hypothetical protein
MKYLLLFTAMFLWGCTPAKTVQTNQTAKVSSMAFPVHDAPQKMFEQIDAVLNQNTGNILSPEDVNNIDLADLSQGTVYNFKNDSFGNINYVFTHVVGDQYYFDVFHEGYKDPGKYRTNGLTSETARIGSTSFFGDSAESCKFSLGECEYTSGSKVVKVVTTFEKGVWTTKKRASGLYGSIYLRKVYDKNGMLLYSSTFNDKHKDSYGYTMRISSGQ